LIDNGSFMPFDVPGSILTEAWDINPKGLVVGGFRDTSGKTHGFLRTNNEYATIDFPGASVTAARGINRDGDIVGFYVDTSGKTHGFLRSKNELGEHERGDDE
jgi:probable HAF family extracellular repeat protein